AVLPKLRSALGSLAVSQVDTLVFCGSSFFSKLRFHPSVKELYTFTSAADNGNNIITNYREAGNMPGISMFRFMDMTFIRVPDDSVYFVGADEAYFVPKFSELTNPFRAIYGPASRHMDVAQMAPQDVFSYTTRDQMQMVSVHNEYSLLPVSQLPSVIVKVTNTTTA
ncbi:major capsid protein, partial [Yersinia massiliensis]|uniref:major capsid protein n=1 Tax=Yersinia massiliensis TaxID=419257 RepID=UPI001643C48C